MPMTRPGRPRLVALLVAAVLVGGLGTTVSAATALPSCTVADTLTKHRAYTDWHRSLLDYTFRLPSSYAPGDLRSTADAGLNGGHSVRAHVIADLKAMATAARNAGARLAVQSAYRSYSTQQATFDSWVRKHGYAVALKESARAGHSEHQLGTSLDFKSYGGIAPWDVADWGTTKAGAWMRANAWKYGFVLSYPKGKTSVTCYIYEPWHWRYVGRERAEQIREQRPDPARIPVARADHAAADAPAAGVGRPVTRRRLSPPAPRAAPRARRHAALH